MQITDLQKLVNAFLESGREQRSQYHLTLQEMIDELEGIVSKGGGDYIVAFQTKYYDNKVRYIGELHSYRGYYDDLAFQPEDVKTTVSEVLAQCKAALGNTFDGYKGGEYLMEGDTPLWVSCYGCNSELAIVGIKNVNEQEKVVMLDIKEM